METHASFQGHVLGLCNNRERIGHKEVMPHFSCQGTLTSKLQLTIDKLTIDKLWVIFVCVFVIDKVTKKAVHLLDFGWPGVLDL